MEIGDHLVCLKLRCPGRESNIFRSTGAALAARWAFGEPGGRGLAIFRKSQGSLRAAVEASSTIFYACDAAVRMVDYYGVAKAAPSVCIYNRAGISFAASCPESLLLGSGFA